MGSTPIASIAKKNDDSLKIGVLFLSGTHFSTHFGFGKTEEPLRWTGLS
jgi:hypothetical protein